MKSKKDILLSVSFWGVVAYALALLTYCTLKNFYKTSADFISAFGSILGACAAFFAAFVAAYLFNDWKEQQRHQNLLHFGLEVYSNFKLFDDLFKKTVEESIVLDHYLTKALENNDLEEIEKLKEDSNTTSKYESELQRHFSNFHDSFVNYCIVTKQEERIEPQLRELANEFNSFNGMLMAIPHIEDISERLAVIKFLTAEENRRVNTKIYNNIIKQILFKIRKI